MSDTDREALAGLLESSGTLISTGNDQQDSFIARDIAAYLIANRAAVLRALNDEQDARNADASRWLWRDRAESETKRAEAAEQSDREAHEALLHTSGRLKAAEAERDKWRNEWHPKALAYFDRAKRAERKVARVEALRDEHADEPHNGHAKWEGEPECPACWTEAIDAALNGDDA